MKRVTLLRYERGLSQTEVAEATGLSRATIIRVESEDAPQPAAATAKALADFYGITVADLLGVEDVAV